jgi:hypothetical protein
VALGQHLPQVTLTGRNKSKSRRQFRSKGEGMPGNVFREVLGMLMPRWDPLRTVHRHPAGLKERMNEIRETSSETEGRAGAQ